MSTPSSISRRVFLKSTSSAGAGLLLSFALPPRLFAGGAEARAAAFAPNAYLSIGSDDRIKLWVTRSEMGQGVRTILPMVLAEELEADWKKIELLQAMPGGKFAKIRLRTSGSGSAVGTWKALREAGATAREMLITAAAQQWAVERGSCRAQSSQVLHIPTGRRLSYGALADAAARLPIPANVALKDPSSFRLLGHRMHRVDAPAIVQGRATYGIDVRVEGMRYAVVARCPVLGGKLQHFDAAKALKVPGVHNVVPIEKGIAGGVAVVADNSWAAMKGREVLEIAWEPGPHRDFESEAFQATLKSALSQDGFPSRSDGDTAKVLESSSRKIEAVYEYPFQAHLPIEPMNCTAHVRSDAVDIWVPTQAPEVAQKLGAQIGSVDPEAVKVHITLLGGGFGRRLFCDYVEEAVELSKKIGAPVQVLWTRDDDTRCGFFHPASVNHLAAAYDGSGAITAWAHREAGSDLSMFGPPGNDPLRYQKDGSPWGIYDNPYNVPNMKGDYVPVSSPVPTGPWRAVEYPSTVFARECFVDELAHATGKDPLILRLELLRPYDLLKLPEETIDRERLRRVLELVADKAAWRSPPQRIPGRRWGRGIACNVYHSDSYIAQVAEVSIGPENDIRVHRIICASDCGMVLNLSGLEGQIESGILWGLTPTLHGKITFKHGQAQQTSYADYRVIDMEECPLIETYALPSNAPPGGLGEIPVPPVAPAVANAIFAATGKRIRQLPITPDKIARA